MVMEMWESQDGAAATIIWAERQSPSRPVKIELMSEDDGEVVVFLSLDDFRDLLQAGSVFIGKASS